MNSLRRTTTSVHAYVRSFTREPLTLALLFLMPVVSIQLYGLSIGGIAEFGLFETDVSLLFLGKVTGAVFATSALTGILGLFQSLGIRTADSRLVISGYRRLELVAARFTTVVITALAVAVLTTVSLEWLIDSHLESVPVTLAGLFLIGGLFGIFGVLVGSVLPRALEGSLVVLSLADVSAIVASGLFPISDSFTHLFPLTHQHDIVFHGVVDGSVPMAHVLPSLGYLLVGLFLASVAYAQVLPGNGEAV